MLAYPENSEERYSLRNPPYRCDLKPIKKLFSLPIEENVLGGFINFSINTSSYNINNIQIILFAYRSF